MEYVLFFIIIMHIVIKAWFLAFKFIFTILSCEHINHKILTYICNEKMIRYKTGNTLRENW